MRGRSAVDLVRHQELREDRPPDEAEGARTVRRFFEHLGAENVGGQEIGRELHALGVEPQNLAERLDELGLGEAGHADQQRMAAAEQRHQRLLDDFLLAEDSAADRLARPLDLADRAFGRGDHGVVEGEGSGGLRHEAVFPLGVAESRAANREATAKARVFGGRGAAGREFPLPPAFRAEARGLNPTLAPCLTLRPGALVGVGKPPVADTGERHGAAAATFTCRIRGTLIMELGFTACHFSSRTTWGHRGISRNPLMTPK